MQKDASYFISIVINVKYILITMQDTVLDLKKKTSFLQP